jgi:hypothetical protein
MNNRTEFKSIKEFLFQENRSFIIPNYQRGYKWAVQLEMETPTAVEKLIRDLIKANKQQEYFLQGVTVTEEDKNTILIDGQQRTITLYLLLWALQYEKFKEINVQYDIREKSKEFIKKLKEKEFDYSKFDEKNKIQDIFYFKKAIEQIKVEIKAIKNKAEFIDFLLDKVTIIYIVIDKSKATKTFTMMNGAKASMLQEELVKAEMLRKISIPDIEDKQVSSSVEDNLKDLKEIITKNWETNALRSRYAREWDKWLYWWNRKDVKVFFNIESPMGLLLDYFYERKSKNKNKFSFDNFRGLITENNKTGKQKTKLIFKELRDLQKSFEDIFNLPVVFNYLGLALIDSGDDKYNIIKYFIENKHDVNKLKEYSKYKLIGSTHKEIIDKNEVSFDDKIENTLNNLKDDLIYQNYYNVAYKLLLRLNIEEDNKLNRKFDFSITKNKSLEHIYPKSKVYHKNDEGKLVDGNDAILDENKILSIKDGTWINRDGFNDNASEHCVGNLVLLYGNNNSEFGAKPVNEKKKTYFDVKTKFKSRHLLHTISVFAEDNWSIEQIQNNKKKIIENFISDYKIKEKK